MVISNSEVNGAISTNDKNTFLLYKATCLAEVPLRKQKNHRGLVCPSHPFW
jgi:hypothetical protein